MVHCPVACCDYTAADDAKMQHHLVQHDPVAIEQNTCVICGVQAVNADRNRLHYIKEHNRFAKVACPGCDAVFAFPQALATHIRRCVPNYTTLQIKNLVDQLPPINQGDGEPNPSRFQREYIKRKRGNYKDTKTTRQAGTAPVKRAKVIANVVYVAKRKAAPVAAPTPAMAPLVFPKPRRVRPMEINVAKRRFTLPMTPPPGLILVSEFNDWQKQQRHFQEKEEEEQEQEEGVEEEEEELNFTYSYTTANTYPLPLFDDVNCLGIPSIRMSDILPPPPPTMALSPLPLDFFLSL